MAATDDLAEGDGAPEARLERGEVLFYPACPFAVPTGDDHAFLLRQRLARLAKNISYNPAKGRAAGFLRATPADAERLRALFAAFSESVTAWVDRTLPRYRHGRRLDQVSF